MFLLLFASAFFAFNINIFPLISFNLFKLNPHKYTQYHNLAVCIPISKIILQDQPNLLKTINELSGVHVIFEFIEKPKDLNQIEIFCLNLLDLYKEKSNKLVFPQLKKIIDKLEQKINNHQVNHLNNSWLYLDESKEIWLLRNLLLKPELKLDLDFYNHQLSFSNYQYKTNIDSFSTIMESVVLRTLNEKINFFNQK